MKRITVIFLLASAAFAAMATERQLVDQPEHRERKTVEINGKRMNTFKTVPHLAVNDQWKSTLNIRNDNNAPIVLEVQFFKPNGDRATVNFFTSDNRNQIITTQTFPLNLSGYELFSFEFDSVEDANSLHIYIFEANDNTNYSIETIYNNYSGSQKLSAVGVGNLPANNNFILNIDHRQDAYSSGFLFRGMAVTNTADSTCNCDVFFYDDGFGGANENVGPYDLGRLTLGPSEKWLWISTDGFAGQDLDNLMSVGLGHIFMECTQPVAVLGLGFEEGSSIVSSVPVDYYNATNGKRSPANE
jgi:hypothetical protein